MSVMKKYNFNAGPSMLPREVVEKTAAAVLDYNGTGLSLMELSHRSAEFKPIIDEARMLLASLLDVPAGYKVLFVGGGASMHFCMVPKVKNLICTVTQTGESAITAQILKVL